MSDKHSGLNQGVTVCRPWESLMIWTTFKAGGGGRSRRERRRPDASRLALTRGGAATSCLLPKYHTLLFLEDWLASPLGLRRNIRDIITGSTVLCLEAPFEVGLV